MVADWGLKCMNGTGDCSGFQQDGSAWVSTPPIVLASAAPHEPMPMASQVYATAWTMAQRDHELDLLFNAEYYSGRDI